MSNLNQLDTEVEATALDLSGNEELEITNATPANLQNEDDNKNTDYEYDAISALKVDPAIIEARVVSYNTCSNAGPAPQQQTDVQEPQSMSFVESLALLQQSARLSITPQQCALLIMYANHLKRQPVNNQPHGECVFCKNNGESTAWYSSHIVKDRKGRVVCPILRAYKCPICGASGSRAHTLKHCPVNKYRL